MLHTLFAFAAFLSSAFAGSLSPHADHPENEPEILIEPVTEDEIYADDMTTADCVMNLCVGHRVRVLEGRLQGFTGRVKAVHSARQELTVQTELKLSVTLPAEKFMRIPPEIECRWGFCAGDKVEVVAGTHDGLIGPIVGFNRSRAQILIYHSRGLVTVPAIFVRRRR